MLRMYDDFTMCERKYDKAFDFAQKSLDIKTRHTANPWSTAFYFMDLSGSSKETLTKQCMLGFKES